MAPKAPLVLMAGLCLHVAGSVAHGFDLFLFVRNFGPTFCEVQRCIIRPINAFSIHGLWPEYEGGGYPQFCKSNSTGTPGASQAMKCEWASLMGPNANFWDHEWERHGTCAEPVLGDRPHFFNTVVDLNRKYDVDVALAAQGIVPSDSRTYRAADISYAIRDSYGHDPVMFCHSGAVLEVWMCLGLDLKPRSCPVHITSQASCFHDVRLPEGNPVSTMCRKYFPHMYQGLQMDWMSVGATAGVMGIVALAALMVTWGCRRPSAQSLGYADLP